MTNNILIKSVALGVLLITLSPINSAAADQVLVQYFNKLYKGASPKCSINDDVKAKIISELEGKCLIREVKPEGSFISGVKAACTEASVKTSVDAQVNALCENPAVKANDAAIAKQVEQQKQEQAKQERAQQQNANNSNALQMAAQGLQAFANIAGDDWGKSKDKGSGSGSRSGSGSGSGSGSNPPPISDSRPVNNPSAYVAPSGGSGSTPAMNNPSAYVAPSGNTGSTPAMNNPSAYVAPSGNKVGEAGSAPSSNDPETQQALENTRGTPAEGPAGQAAAPAKETETDPAQQEREAKSQQENDATAGKLEGIEKKISGGTPQIATEATTTCNAEMGMGPASAECTANKPQTAIDCVNGQITKFKADMAELKKDKESCAKNAAQAEKLCSMLRSDKANDVQKLMSVGATVLSKVTAASEACGTTSDISKLAQGGMMAAQGACTAMKYRCDFSCAAAEKTLKKMKASAAAMEKCPLQLISAPGASGQVNAAIAELKTHLDQELAPGKMVPASIEQCQKHKADIALMGVAALGFLSAFQDAQSCKKQLASGGQNQNGKSTSGLAGPQMTTAEYCSAPANAASLTCKCTTNPQAEGCIGSLAKSGVNIGKINSGNGPSAFASAKQNGLGALNSSGKSATGEELPPGANLSEAAREALGMNAVAPGGEMGSAAGGGGSSEAAKKAKEKDEEKEKPKFGFFSSLGNMMSGGKSPTQAATAAIRKHEQDEAIKRKIASDQVRAEISKASGKSNFDKIKSRYQQNAASFEQ